MSENLGILVEMLANNWLLSVRLSLKNFEAKIPSLAGYNSMPTIVSALLGNYIASKAYYCSGYYWLQVVICSLFPSILTENNSPSTDFTRTSSKLLHF